MRARILLLLGLAACSVQDTSFAPSIDGAPPPDGDDGVLRIVADPASLDIVEGESQPLLLRLSQAPPAPVTVTITGVSGVATVDPAVLAFTATDFDTPQQVIVTSVEDDDTGDASGDLALASDGATPTLEVPVVVDDDDELALVVDPETATLGETSSADVRVHLSAQPGSDVVIEAAIDPPGAAAVNASLTFTPANWSTDQIFHVTGVNDPNAVTDFPTLNLTGDAVPSRSIPLTVIDDDVQNFNVTTGTVAITEGGANGSFGVSLYQDPGGVVTVSLAETSDAFHLSTTQLVFNASDYQTVKTVNVIPDDDDDVADENGLVTISATGIPSTEVSVGVSDDDVQEILHSAAGTLTLAEGGQAQFNVRLAYRPSSNLTVTIASSDSGAASPTPASILFMPGDFDQDRTVVITGTQDNDLANESPTITLSATGVAPVSIPASVTDEDVQDILVSVPSITIVEGDSEIVTARLAFQPTSTTMVTVSSTNPAVTAMPSALSFTTSDWATPKNVTLTAPSDSNTADETAIVTFSGGGADATIGATVDDQTVVTNLGWSTYFNNATTLDGGVAMAYKVTVPTTTTLGRFGVIVASAGGDAKMALYADSADAPSTFVAGSNTATSLSAAGVNYIDVPDVQISAGTYWLAIRVNPDAAVGQSTSQMARRCYRLIGNFTDVWPNPMGTTSCGNALVMNLFMETYQ